MTDKLEFTPDYRIPPGETLRETLNFLRMDEVELNRITGISVNCIRGIFLGVNPITVVMSVLLEQATNVPASMWRNLEKQYRKPL
jgi:plasmid maintenance system antidote protein VapI